MGGLISLYALNEYPKVFGGAVCLYTHWIGIFESTANTFPRLYLGIFRKAPTQTWNAQIGCLEKLKGLTTASDNKKLACLPHLNFYLIKVIFLVKL